MSKACIAKWLRAGTIAVTVIAPPQAVLAVSDDPAPAPKPKPSRNPSPSEAQEDPPSGPIYSLVYCSEGRSYAEALATLRTAENGRPARPDQLAFPAQARAGRGDCLLPQSARRSPHRQHPQYLARLPHRRARKARNTCLDRQALRRRSRLPTAGRRIPGSSEGRLNAIICRQAEPRAANI